MSKVKFPPRVRIFCAFDNFERKIKVSGADRYFGIPMNPPGKPYEAISIAEHESKISQLEERLRVARDALIFYSDSDPDDYIAQDILDWDLVNNGAAIQDKGKRAREALAAIKEKKE